jgi:D-amino-acid dehydrogenase
VPIFADEYVVCGGIWSQHRARARHQDPDAGGQGYSLTLDAPPRSRCVRILSEARVALTPMGHALRFAGTMELGGIDESIHPARVRGMVKSIGGTGHR